MNIIPNKTDYNTTNVNGARLVGANIIKTYETQIHRFYSKTMGVISSLYLMNTDTTYIWLSVDSDEEDTSKLQRISMSGVVSNKAIKQYLKSYLLENDIRITDEFCDISIEKATDKHLNTTLEIINYQGNIMITFADKWFDIALMSIEVKRQTLLKRYGMLDTFVYGGDDFGNDKLIELFGQIEYDMKQEDSTYITTPIDMH